ARARRPAQARADRGGGRGAGSVGRLGGGRDGLARASRGVLANLRGRQSTNNRSTKNRSAPAPNRRVAKRARAPGPGGPSPLAKTVRRRPGSRRINRRRGRLALATTCGSERRGRQAGCRRFGEGEREPNGQRRAGRGTEPADQIR